MRRAPHYFDWLGRLVTRELGRRVLEVGCGVGNFTRLLLDRELVVAVDLEPECIGQLVARYPNQANLQAVACDVHSPEFSGLAAWRLDSCACLNVLEHVADDRLALQRIASVLAPDGAIVLLLPAFPALYGPIDRNLGHYRRYTRASLGRLAQAAGLRIRKAHYMNALGFFGWWWNAHVSRREAQSETQIEILDRFLVPVMSSVEEVVKPVFGQSLFAVLERA